MGEHIIRHNIFLILEKKMSSEGSDSLAERVQRIWKTLITNKYGTQVSWTGQKRKPPVLKSEMFKLAVGGIYFNFFYFVRVYCFFYLFSCIMLKSIVCTGGQKKIEIH